MATHDNRNGTWDVDCDECGFAKPFPARTRDDVIAVMQSGGWGRIRYFFYHMGKYYLSWRHICPRCKKTRRPSDYLPRLPISEVRQYWEDQGYSTEPPVGVPYWDNGDVVTRKA